MKKKIMILLAIAGVGVSLTACSAGTTRAIERECGAVGAKSMTWIPTNQDRRENENNPPQEFHIVCNDGTHHNVAVE